MVLGRLHEAESGMENAVSSVFFCSFTLEMDA
jgi:hypothetical protein